MTQEKDPLNGLASALKRLDTTCSQKVADLLELENAHGPQHGARGALVDMCTRTLRTLGADVPTAGGTGTALAPSPAGDIYWVEKIVLPDREVSFGLQLPLLPNESVDAGATRVRDLVQARLEKEVGLAAELGHAVGNASLPTPGEEDT